LGGYPLWIAHYGTTCPLIPDGWSKWSFWQYCDGNTQYCANGQGFDRNVYNGTVAELTDLAGGGGADYGATYVNQTFPLASTTIQLVSNETISGYFELQNTGALPWDANTKLGTTEPRDRPSAFADATWPAPNRAAAVVGEVAPGESYKFEVTMRAPSQPGVYSEYFGVLQEGVTWFSEPGQGGPADNLLQVKFEVRGADYSGELVDMSFADSVAIPVNGSTQGWIEIRNTGNLAWKTGEVFLAPTPREQESPVYDESWSSPTRITTPGVDVPPGSSYKFQFTLSGKTNASFTQTFGLVKEGETWFSEAPLGGGPTDEEIAINVVIGEGGSNNGNNNTYNPNNSTNGANPSEFPDLIGTSTGTEGGCSQTNSADLSWLALALGFVVFRRRRATH